MESTIEANSMVSTIHTNLSSDALIEFSLRRKESERAANEALVVKTGARTGRSPKDRFIVRDAITENSVQWNTINQPLSASVFTKLWEKAFAHLQNQPEYFVSKLKVGAVNAHAVPVTVITELAWHHLFTRILFIAHDTEELTNKWTLLNVPGFKANPNVDGTASDAAVIINFSERKILITGTYYAGEMKKAMFSVLNFLLPEKNILPMHCAANMGKDGKTALFFGLSGTGKTTLSADPNRFLIGDDEHGWGVDGVFNFEGGCYAKCIDLSQEREPLIWDAIRYGAIVENVVLDPINKEPNYADSSLTQNTRAAYPREFIPARVEENYGPQPSAVIFLTCDLYGVLPPVSKLTKAQAAYYFLSGYTALVGSTEVGEGSGIKSTFSTCFGAPFFPRAPQVYAELLLKRLTEHPADVFLVNTGWTGGAHGKGGQRFSIPVTRQIVSAIVNNELKNVDWETLAGFNLSIPKSLPGVSNELLNPKKSWQDSADYDHHARLLMEKFIDNFKKFSVSTEIHAAGPTINNAN